MNMYMTDDSEEIKEAQLMRSLDIMIDSWENDDLSLDDMADQMEAASKIIEGTSTLSEFTETTNLHNREKLH